jgi:hypothetical protein
MAYIPVTREPGPFNWLCKAKKRETGRKKADDKALARSIRQKMKEHRTKTFSMDLSPADVEIMYGAIRVLLEERLSGNMVDIKTHEVVPSKYPDDFKETARDLVVAVSGLYVEMGLTEEELEYLNYTWEW